MSEYAKLATGGAIGAAVGTDDTLLTNLESQAKRLCLVAETLESAAVRFFGPSPASAKDSVPEGRPVTSVSSLMRDISFLISRVDSVAAKISNGI